MPSISRYAKPRALITIFLAALISLPPTFLAPTIARAAVAIGGNAVVVTTEGDTLTIRSGPGRQFPTIGALAQGTVVAVLAGPQASDDGVSWMQVQGAGLTGWCSAEWLGDPAPAPAPAPATPTATPASAPPAATATVTPTVAPVGTPDSGSTLNGSGSPRVSGTNGRGARLRAMPSLNGAVVTVIPEGAEVVVTGANVNAEGYAWVPVTYLAMSGWVASGLLAAAAAAAPTITKTPAPTPAVTPVAAPPPTAPPATPPAAPTPPAPTPSGGVGLTVGGNATIVDTDGFSLRIRAKPGLDAPIVSFAPPGAVVGITAGPQNDGTGAPWWGITYSGSSGWVLGEHLAPLSGTPAAPTAPTTTPTVAATATPNTRPAPTATPSPATTAVPVGNRGQNIVATALRYLGVPYVYGGTTPSGWDCSGFVGYIYQTAAGITLPRSAAQQYRVGTTIGAAQVQAGDIVFFSDTFGPGITHNGIALGDGRFVHARSEGYGTTISSLSDPYWSGHYAGAQRP